MNVPKWTGSLIGKMHNHKVSKSELAEKLGFTPEYVSMVLNGKKEPKGAEEKFNQALNEIIEEKGGAL